MTTHILIGTAGHIDHGKTRLVGRLTGINTDRLPEEQARGISIDLGFAHFEADGIRFGVVDVPGHERFIKNMVAGATGVNLVMLVVAADDSVMPQTREHLEIMQLLGISAGLVVITKTDLVEPEFVDLVRADIESLLSGTFLDGCPILPVSSATGDGLDDLQATLVRLAREVVFPETSELFRMPIDRVFSVAGHGTVVTGSVLSGSVKPEDTLELLPAGREVRVRGVQHHGSQAVDAVARQRTAINLAGVKIEEVERGMELAAVGYLQPSQRMLIELQNLASSPLSLRDRQQFHLHLGTREVLSRINLKGVTVAPGERTFAELRTQEPITAIHGQRYILRRLSPSITVAGGRILDPSLPPMKRIKEIVAVGTKWSAPSDANRLGALVSQQEIISDSPLEAARRVGIQPSSYRHLLEELSASGQLVRLRSGSQNAEQSARPLDVARGITGELPVLRASQLIHKDRLAGLSVSVMKSVREVLAKHQPRRALSRELFVASCQEIAYPMLLEAAFNHLLVTGELVRVGTQIGPADAQVKLTKSQQTARTRILEEIAAAGLMPPTTRELAAAVGQGLEQIAPLLHVSCEDGLLIKLSDELYYSADAIELAKQLCCTALTTLGQATMSQLRDAWGVSRKYSIPLCEYLDQIGFTVRVGDLRKFNQIA
ncbi:MAG: selenocysteine-specific translation elongation factor [Planctomycetia bacterium]|nr:selenocysteine-specific translation elongation factor [Planctomycetia bacterium]